MAASAAIGLAPAVIVGSLVDVLSGKKPGHSHDYILALLVVAAVGVVVGIVRNRLMHIAGERLVLQIRTEAYAAVQRLSFSFFDRSSTGDTMSRLSSDVNAIGGLLVSGTDAIVVNVLRVIIISVWLIQMDWRIALAVAGPAPIIAVSVAVFGKRIRAYSRKIRDQLGDLNAKLQECIVGIRVIKAFSAEDREYEKVSDLCGEYAASRIRLVRMWTLFYPAMHILAAAGVLSATIVGTRLIEQGVLSVGDLVTTLGLLMMFYGPIEGLSKINETIQRSLAAADRVFELMDAETDVADREEAVELGRAEGRVEIRSATLRYGDGGDVLHDVSIMAEPGECVALVGPSGAGKTSIINLIPRFYDPVEGQVLVDGYDARDIAKRSLRSNVAIVLQDTFLFDGTVRENIAYARPEASSDEIAAAADAANAAEFIDDFEEGYETVVGERGTRLSGGQKQRISIARALLADPRILVLDEATSAVDTAAEILIHQALERLIEGRTTFIIAHRLSTIRNADRIVVLDGGRVAEVGRHADLMARGGAYARMYELQFSLAEAGPGAG